MEVLTNFIQAPNLFSVAQFGQFGYMADLGNIVGNKSVEMTLVAYFKINMLNSFVLKGSLCLLTLHSIVKLIFLSNIGV